jgi:Putative prokaryotic signal transducing protein
MPLVYAAGRGAGGDEGTDERREQARKIKPQYSEGKLVKVAGAQNGAEAEMIQGILLEEGIPSMQQRSLGSDVPDFLVAGRRDVMVPESGAQAAREALAWDMAEEKGSPGEEGTGGETSPGEEGAGGRTKI